MARKEFLKTPGLTKIADLLLGSFKTSSNIAKPNSSEGTLLRSVLNQELQQRNVRGCMIDIKPIPPFIYN